MYFQSAIRKSWTSLLHNNKHPLKSSTEGSGCKTHQSQKIIILQNLVAESCTTGSSSDLSEFSIHLQMVNSTAMNIPGVVAAESVLEAMGLANPLGVIVGGYWPITFWRTSRIFSCRLDLFGKISTCAAWEKQARKLPKFLPLCRWMKKKYHMLVIRK